MIECCKTCGSIITNDECSNKRCQDKINKTNAIMNQILDEMNIESGTIIACPRNGTGCIVKKIGEK